VKEIFFTKVLLLFHSLPRIIQAMKRNKAEGKIVFLNDLTSLALYVCGFSLKGETFSESGCKLILHKSFTVVTASKRRKKFTTR
jgi:hypothetical protein